MLLKSISNHLKESDMTMSYHCRHGLVNGFRLIIAGIASIIHAVLPFWFKSYSPKVVIRLYYEIKNRKHIQQLMKEVKNEYK